MDDRRRSRLLGHRKVYAVMDSEGPTRDSDGIDGTLLPGTIHDDVIVGFDGYLFQAWGRDPETLSETVEQRIAEGGYESFRQNLEGRLQWASGHGAQFLHVIIPERSSIVPEAFPFPDAPRVGEAFLAWTDDLAEHILYPLDALAEHKARALSPLDSHLRDYGSILIAALTVERLTGESQDNAIDELAGCMQSDDSLPGDLGSRFEPPILGFGEWLECDEAGVSFIGDCGYGDSGSIHLRFNAKPPYRKRVAVFGDPSARDVVRMLQYWYQEVYFFCSPYFHEEIASLCKPDIILILSSEGDLGERVVDEERPNFFLYRLGEVPAPESSEFREALNAVLSFSRQPYADFIASLPTADSYGFQLGTSTSPQILAAFDSLVLIDWPAELGLVRTLEDQEIVEIAPPVFLEDLSGRNLALELPSKWQIHASYLTTRNDVLLFGQSHLISPQGYWSCEAREYKGQFIYLTQSEGFGVIFPGIVPIVEVTGTRFILRTSHLRPDQVERIDEPVFLATPLEPVTWGRWVATVVPRIAQFRTYGAGRKFLCMVDDPWQRRFLNLFGLDDDIILDHHPGRTYLCRDVMTVEFSEADLMISTDERLVFAELASKHWTSGKRNRRLFFSRKSISEEHPHYRVLQNEAALSDALAQRGFTVISPETLPLEEQIDLYASAEHIVSLGGSALFNAAFCGPGTKIVTIESSDYFASGHARFLSSLGLEYGIIFGEQDPSDPEPIHKRWTIDVERACAAIDQFMPKRSI